MATNAPKQNDEPTVKASFNLRPALVKQLKYIALMDETTQTEILNTQLSKFVQEWEKRNGKIPVK